MSINRQLILKKFIKQENGALSIMLTLLLPIFIMGVLILFMGLKKQQTDNRIRQMALMSSEAYLSKVNSYMWESYKMQSTLDEGGLDQMIRHYITLNHLVASPDTLELETSYDSLNNPHLFKKAALAATESIVIDTVAEFSVGLLESWNGLQHIKKINDQLSDYEKALSAHIDQSELGEMLEDLKNIENEVDYSSFVNSIKVHLNTKKQEWIENCNGYDRILDQALVTTPVESSIEAYIESKRRQTALMKAEFQLLSSSISEGLDKLLDTLNDQTDDDTLESYRSTVIDQMLSQFGLDETIKSAQGFLGRLKRQMAELELTLSGLEVGDGKLDLESGKNKPYDFSGYKREVFASKILLNEYYLMVLSSYDQRCPRKLSVGNRPEIVRTLKGEIEFLISGEAEEKTSVSEVRIKIMGIRTLANLVAFMSDAERINQLSVMTSAFPQPWGALAFGTAVTAWCTVESYGDTNALFKGKAIPLIKSTNQWRTTLSGSSENAIFKLSGDDQETEIENSSTNVFDLYYLDYLRLLLMLQNEETSTARAMQLIDHEIKKTSKDAYSLKDFSIGHRVNLKWKHNTMPVLNDQDESGFKFSNGQYQ